MESITVKGDSLEIKYAGSDEKKIAKKEEGDGFIRRFFITGVVSEKIAAVKIEIKIRAVLHIGF